jgi:hypothetical protein
MLVSLRTKIAELADSNWRVIINPLVELLIWIWLTACLTHLGPLLLVYYYTYMCCSDEEFIARSYASLFADSSIAKNSCVPAWATLMTREEKVHGSFSQGSQPLTSSFQRLRVKVCKILRSTTDSGETWHYWMQCEEWGPESDRMVDYSAQVVHFFFTSTCILPPLPMLRSKFRTIPSLLVHNIYLAP